MVTTSPVPLVNPWALVAGAVAPNGLPAPSTGVVAGVAGGVVLACAYAMAPAATTSPLPASSSAAPVPDIRARAVAAERPPPRRTDEPAPTFQRSTTRPVPVKRPVTRPVPVTRPAPVGRRMPAAGKGVRIISGRVTSGFGRRNGGMHWGLDLAAPIGTPIHVPLGGTVISAGPAKGFGRWVRIRHADGTVTVYGHVNRALVTVGERVRAGAVIAEVGNRGQSTGPHLHIEVVRADGRKVDPRRWLDARGIGY
jgi:murein DD-endopeptidase MepM/ murein hydrolase activator NlpD